MNLHELTASEALQKLNSREISSVELTTAVLERIAATDGQIKAYMTVLGELGLRMAREADAARAQGANSRPLLGLPLTFKDILHIKGEKTTCSSRMLEKFVAPYDATVTRKLREAGAVFVGKTNMDEFAMGSSTENSGFFTSRNPYDSSCIPGGSSGGSAAAVAADSALLALGSDTGGSIRQPAALCGINGMKPTYGRVSRYGLVAFASSLDQIGPMTKSIPDLALLLNTLCGRDPMDSTSADVDVPDFTAQLGREIKGLRLGVPKEYFIAGLDGDVQRAVDQAIARLCAAGAEAVEISLPHTEYAVAVYYICCTAEASSNLARYDGAHYGYRAPGTKNIVDLFTRSRSQAFGPEVKRRIMLGTYVLSAGFYDAYYTKALQVRTLLQRDFADAFAKCDVIVTPTTPTPAFAVGAKADDPLQMYLNDIFTTPANLAGIPALSIPCGYSAGGLPIGLQFLAPAFGEEQLIRVADFHEREWAPGNRRRPVMS